MSHHHYKRAKRWLQKPTRVIKAKFSLHGEVKWHPQEILRTVTPEMRPWIPDERLHQELLGLARRNGWIT